MKESDLRRYWPHGDDEWIAVFVAKHQDLGDKYGVTTLLRWRHFLAQVSAETDGIRCDGRGGACVSGMRENLAYRPASLLAANGYRVKLAQRDVPRFRSMSLNEVAAALCADHDLLAETVYGGRKDLGNTHPGDGAKFIGRGPLQTTGREAYTMMAAKLGIDCVNDPSMLEQPAIGWEATFIEWHHLGCNALADTDDVELVSRRVNGGTNGLSARRAWLHKAEAFFSDEGSGEDHEAREIASLSDLRSLGSTTAQAVGGVKGGAKALGILGMAAEAAGAAGDTVQKSTDTVQAVADKIDGVKPAFSIIQAHSGDFYAVLGFIHAHVGAVLFLLAILLAYGAFRAEQGFVTAYRSGRYSPRRNVVPSAVDDPADDVPFGDHPVLAEVAQPVVAAAISVDGPVLVSSKAGV